MTRSVFIHRHAEEDTAQSAQWIARDSTEQAAAYLVAVLQTIRRLAEHPGVGAPYETLDPALAGLRRVPVAGFRSYLIVYNYDDARVVVFRVVHGARNLPKVLQDESPET